MSSLFGENLKLSIFGQSHGAAIGMVLDGIPAGLPVDTSSVMRFLERRAPGGSPLATSRKETDTPTFLSGIVDGYTCGAPIAAVIGNKNVHSQDYAASADTPRPGHADYTAFIKHGGFQDVSGGGHFSGRLTAPLCIAGSLCKQWLAQAGIHVFAKIGSIGTVRDDPFSLTDPQAAQIHHDFPVLNKERGYAMQEAILAVKSKGDSIGGTIQCAATGVPAGVGEPMFSSVESHISQLLFSIPGVRAVEFGVGAAASTMTGSQHNDPFTVRDSTVVTTTNHCGGILGGITTGMPLVFSCTIKPTPSIASVQNTISLSRMQPADISVCGRHDPCIVPRAVPVVESAAAIAIYDLLLGNTQTPRRK